MHTVFAWLLINKRLDLSFMPNIVAEYVHRKQLKDIDQVSWIQDLKQDILGLAQWMYDYKVEPLAIEIALKSDKYKVAGMLDLLAYVTVPVKGYWGQVYKAGANKGKPKESTKNIKYLAIVDFKGRRKNYTTDADLMQLAIYEILLRENFKEFRRKKLRLFSFRPADWNTTPSYHCIDQTGKFERRILDYYLKIYNAKYPDPNNITQTFITGEVVLGDTPNIHNCIDRIKAQDLINWDNLLVEHNSDVNQEDFKPLKDILNG